MSKEVVIIAVHGMGDTEENFAEGFKSSISKRLGEDAWSKVYFDTVYYQGVLQPNQKRVMDAMKKRDIDWIRFRRFMLYGFSDAAGLERRADEKDSPYHETQKIIRSTLERAFDFIGGSVPVILFTHSLGGQVISNYIWDAQQRQPARGTWKHDATESSPKKNSFLRLKTLKYLYTTGCNIPIFVSGFPKDEIKAVKSSSKGYAFRWKNFYDPDDVLGWPLQPLSPTYKDAVFKDIPVNANGSVLGTIAGSWNPFAHNLYWKDGDILKPLASDVRSML